MFAIVTIEGVICYNGPSIARAAKALDPSTVHGMADTKHAAIARALFVAASVRDARREIAAATPRR